MKTSLVCIILSSFLTEVARYWRFSLHVNTEQSSANKTDFNLLVNAHISLIKIKESSGPATIAWETPGVIGIVSGRYW